MRPIVLTVNGVDLRVQAADDDMLLDVLRRDAGCTSVREGCGVGACGACTVLVSGRSVSSCLARAVAYDGADITTADGLPAGDDVVAAFVDGGAMQCGYCIPGMVLMTHELLAENSAPDDEAVASHLEGNKCRCGAYPEIRRAIDRAAVRRRG
ncbi:MAG: 2Fe-2S iron-sulfur cluster binding domain-containing protein [Streptosporangiales bacterium]|nr:2Fe-2S iron-sulfur cluster binding domain-containing protein [Streptosporangiales bacterium]